MNCVVQIYVNLKNSSSALAAVSCYCGGSMVSLLVDRTSIIFMLLVIILQQGILIRLLKWSITLKNKVPTITALLVQSFFEKQNKISSL